MILNPNTTVESLNPYTEAYPESSQIDCVADTGKYQVTTVTIPATASAAQADYLYFENVAGDDFAIWLDIDDNGTAPSGAVYTATTNKIEVNIATGGTAAVNATAVKDAIELNGNWADVTIVDNEDGTLTFTQDIMGVAVNPSGSAGDELSAGSITTSTVAGVASNLLNTSFALNTTGDATTYYVWFNVASEGVDPSGTGTGVEITLSNLATANDVASALATAINALAGFYAQADLDKVFMNNATTGTATDIADVDSPLTFSVRFQGKAGTYYPGISPASLNNNPSV